MPLEDLHSASAVIFNWDAKLVASAILIISYLILFTEKLNRAVVALVGACIMIFAGVLTQETAIAGIDFNTLALLTGMMIIVGIAEKSGMFQYVAVPTMTFRTFMQVSLINMRPSGPYTAPAPIPAACCSRWG